MAIPNVGEWVTATDSRTENNIPPLDRLAESDILEALALSISPSLSLPEDHSQPVSPRQAGVLVPFVRHSNGWALVFIRRAQSRRDRHSGQVAFAGGMRESHDLSLCHTALREAHEEIGLKPDDARLLGELPIHRSIAGIAIKPVVATMPWPYPLQPERAEVARVFTIPLTWLATADNYEVVDIASVEAQHSGKSVSYREFDGERLWGATARITLTLVMHLLAYCGQPLQMSD